jgi:DNA mismatch repair protein MutL
MTHDMRSDGVEREQSGDISSGPKLTQQQRDNINSWEDLYQDLQANTNQSQAITLESDLMNQGDDQPVIIASKSRKDPYQIHNTYIVNQIKSGFLLIDQQAAHERILYEGYIEQLNQHVGMTQKQLFPISVDLTPADATLLHNILHKVNAIGFEIEHFGKNSFIIHGLPVGIDNQSPEKLLETLLQQYHSNIELQLGIDRNLARSMANAACIKRGKLLQADEMHELVDQLFACTVPYKSPNGRKCFITMELDDLLKRFTT